MAKCSEVGEFVGGVGKEAEECAIEGGVFPGIFFDGGEDSEDKDTGDKDQVKDDSGEPVDLIAEEVADHFLVEAFSEPAEPDDIDGEEDDSGEEESEDEFHG